MTSLSLRTLAWINVAIHALGVILAGLGMQPGSPLVSVEQRTAYLSSTPLLWQTAWCSWVLCALALGAFIVTSSRRLPQPSDLAHLAGYFAVAGAGVDLLCDSIQITVLPMLARQGDVGRVAFLAFERAAGAGGLIAANGLYTLAVGLVNASLRGVPGTATRLCGWGVVVAGSLMAVAGFLDSALLAAAGTAPMVGLFALWTVLVARVLEKGA